MPRQEKIDLVKDSDMLKAAQLFAKAIKKYAPYDSLKKSVRIGRREGKGTSKFITVHVGKKWKPGLTGAEYAARAFDVGSGIHGKSGQPYKIRARNYPTLQFQGTNEFAGKIIRKAEVDHPGVAGVGYI